ncbi:M24 family metallopeptidase [Romboutsia timonensis]|uniref:M24 family metallopeptidase n=1 Tax=Romboutsia timonensis TaxID=1776391 RepID=UPI000939F286|nr:M24 family metallopeptidase [Romboutsia timonensis]
MNNQGEKQQNSKDTSSVVVEKLLSSRSLIISGEINQELAEKVATQLLILQEMGDEPIKLFINSQGGHVEAGDTIHDMIKFIKPRIIVIGTGWVASAGITIYLAADKEDRYSLPNTRYMIHQPLGGCQGQATDINIEAKEIAPIIAYGANGADPHAHCGSAKLKEGDCVILDIGCIKDNYCSDMTRTVFYKSAPEKAKEVFNIVLEANKRAIAMVKPGVRFCDIDNAAREYITEKGYGKYFTHRTGHSIGIETHDMGDVSSINTDILKPGMIFSVEPGIYLPGEFGVRIEDLVLVTEDGHELLNKYNKELNIIK